MLKSLFSSRAVVPCAGRRAFTILSAGILTLTTAPSVFPAAFTWTNVDGNWSEAAKWQGGVVPPSAATTDLVFGGTGTSLYTATNNLANPFQLNALVLNSSSTAIPVLAGTPLEFLADDTGAQITQNGTGGFLLNFSILATSPLTMNGTGTGVTQLAGDIGGGGGLTFETGDWQLSNAGSTFSGGITINTGARVELFPAPGGDLNVTPGAASYLGSNVGNVLTINGGTVKFTTTANIVLGRLPVTFGANGGVLDLRNGSGTPGVQGGGIATAGGGDFNLTLNNAPENIAVLKFNGGEVGHSTGSATDGNWSTGNNAVRFNSLAGTGPLRVELTNGAMLRGSTGASGTINIPLIVRGVIGGDPTSGPDGTVNTGLSTTTGRFAIDSQNVTNHTRGLTFEGAVQVAVVGTTRALDGNIVIAGTASGAPGYVTFSGRGTNTQLNATVNNPGTGAIGQNVLWIGQGQNDTLTIQPGGIAVFDPRIRTDTGGSNGNGVLLDGTAVINPGGILRIAQSVSNFTPGVAQTTANVGDIIIRGDIRGEGNTTTESVLEIALPAPKPGATVSTGVPFTFAGDTTAGQRPYGGLRFEDTTGNADFIINGTGFGGLRINGIARPNALIENGAADPVSTLTKLNDALTPTRLARLSGTGGYLSVAPAGQTFAFPAGGEWTDPDVGFKVIDHNSAGADVSFAALSGWSRALAVDSGATLNLGSANPFTLGGTVHGKGIIVGSGTAIVSPSGAISPGLDDIGTLTINSALTLNGNLVIGVQPASSDLLNIGGNLTLGGPLLLSGTYGVADLEIARYSGTLTGTFSSITGLSADFSVDYGTRNNGAIRLVHTVLPTLIWDGAPANTWSVGGGNWKGGATFTNGSKVQFDDAATGSTSVVVSGSDVSPNLITVNNSTKAYTITSAPGAAVVGGAQLIKNGTGLLTLTGPASFGGGIALNAGELRIGATDSLPNTGTITVALNAKLETQGNNDTVGELIVNGQVSGGGTLTVSGLTLGTGVSFTPNLTLNGNLTKTGAAGTTLSGGINLGGSARTFDVAAGTAPELTLGGVVSNGGLTKAGAGTLVLNNPNNSFTGGLSVLAGMVRALIAGALPANNNVTVAAGGAVEANGFNSILRLLDLSGTFQTSGGNLSVTGLAGANSGALSLGGGSLTIDAQGTNSFAGAINDASSLTKMGAGTQGLSGTNTIAGNIQLNAGILGIGAVGAAGSGAINVAAGATLDLGADIANVVNLNGGTMGNTGGRNYQGTLNVTADSFITNSDPDTPTAGADLVIVGNGFQGTGNLTVRGITGVGGADGSSGVRARSTAPSTYSGTVTVLNSTKFESQMPEGGTNPIGTAKVRLTGGTVTGGLNGTYSQFNIRTASGNPVFGTDVEVIGTGLANINPVNTGAVTTDQRLTLGSLRIGAGQSLGVNKNGTPTHTVIFTSVTLTGGNATFAPNTMGMGYSGTADLVLGPISESAPGAGIIMDGQATLFLTGANTFTGPTILQRGTTRLGAAGALPSATALTMAGGTLDFHDNAGASFDQTVRSLTGSLGDITNTDVAARTLTIDQTASTAYAGTITGNLGVVKRGTGSLTLNGANSFSGAARAEGGTLVVNGTISAPTTITGNAILAGTGSVGNLLGQNGARIAPGDGATGTLNAGTVTLDGANLSIEIFGTTAGTGYDQLHATGAVSLTNNPTLTLTLGFDPADKIDLFTIILNDQSGNVSGTFANLPNGAIFLAGTQQFQISYADNAATPAFELTGGNDVSLLAVPEPTVGLSFLGGIALCLARRRRHPHSGR